MEERMTHSAVRTMGSGSTPKRPKSILVTGHCSLHWGRMEFGNVGNAYIAYGTFGELRRVFPTHEIRTTLQMSDAFCRQFGLSTMPLESYYGWTGSDLLDAWREYGLAKAGLLAAEVESLSQMAREADLAIDFSGDMWGANGDFAGPDRFQVGAVRSLTLQSVAPATAMIAGSPGPFAVEYSDLARKAYGGFDLVVNREPVSTRLLSGKFDVSRTIDSACPAFLFDSSDIKEPEKLLPPEAREARASGLPIFGFSICGWNFARGPFDAEFREDEEFQPFVELISRIERDLGAHVVLISHANGFAPPPARFVLTHGRDYPLATRLYSLARSRGLKCVSLSTQVLEPPEVHAMIGTLDLFVSGRAHGAVAGFTNAIPTVVIDYGHEPRAHKLAGFAEVADMADFVADPADPDTLFSVVRTAWAQRQEVASRLSGTVERLRQQIRKDFDRLADLVGEQ